MVEGTLMADAWPGHMFGYQFHHVISRRGKSVTVKKYLYEWRKCTWQGSYTIKLTTLERAQQLWRHLLAQESQARCPQLRCWVCQRDPHGWSTGTSMAWLIPTSKGETP